MPHTITKLLTPFCKTSTFAIWGFLFKKMNTIIPITMLISCAYIIWYMMNEKKQPVEVVSTPELSEEQMFIIEQKMQRDNLFCANWWSMDGRFNTSHYVKYLEYKELN